MILVWCLLGIIYLRRKRKVGLKGLREGSMLVRPSRAPALPPPQARKTKQGYKPMLLDAKQAGNPERDVPFVSSFHSLRKVPASAWNLFGAIPKPVSLSAKRTYDSEMSIVTVLTGTN